MNKKVGFVCLLVAILLTTGYVIKGKVKGGSVTTSKEADGFTHVKGWASIYPVLTKDNVVVLDSVILRDSVEETVDKLVHRPDTEPTYLILNTPGGSVFDGFKLVDYLKSTKKNIICIAKQAQSMGFMILQACPKRYSTENTTLMAHELAGGLGQINLPDLRKTLQDWEKLQHGMNMHMANRIGITEQKLKELMDPMWLTYYGPDAAEINIVDGVAYPSCDKELYDTKKTISWMILDENSMPAIVRKEVNSCPI